MLELTPLQQDALCEIFNIGVGHAAATMSEMVQEEVQLSVPRIQFLAPETIAQNLHETCQTICSVRQAFEGNFRGDAVLIFPEEKSLEIVRLMLGQTVPLEHLAELEQDALTEVGNILLNACLASLADMLSQQFECSLPVLQVVAALSAFDHHEVDSTVMFVHISFRLEKREINGYMMFVMNADSLDQLRLSVDNFLNGFTGGAA